MRTNSKALILAMALACTVLIACRTAQTPPEVPADWARCQTDDECSSVAWRCCPCGVDGRVGVNRAHVSEADTQWRPRGCHCERMMCPALHDRCVAGVCRPGT